jgi:hypothetical protein
MSLEVSIPLNLEVSIPLNLEVNESLVKNHQHTCIGAAFRVLVHDNWERNDEMLHPTLYARSWRL